MAALASDPRMCKRCAEPGCTLNCPCKQGYYCSKECQKADFPVHKHHCSVWLTKKMHKAKRDNGGENEASADAKMDAAMGLQNRGKIQESLALISEARSAYEAVLPDTHFKIGWFNFSAHLSVPHHQHTHSASAIGKPARQLQENSSTLGNHRSHLALT
jgi:hypothetical protein